MPQFPRYESQRDLTTQQPAFLAPAETSGKALEAAAEVGQTAQNATVKWVNAVDTIQKTTASANFKAGVADILQRAQNDPNYNNSDAYLREIDKLRQENLKGFATKTAETEASINFNYEARVAALQVENLYKKKMIDVGQTATMKLLDMESNNPSPGMEERMNRILSEQVNAGIIGHKDAYKLQQEYLKKGKYNSFLLDMNTDPAVAEENLSKNAYGFDMTEMAKARKFQSSLAKKQEQERKQAQLDTANDLGQKLASKTLTPEEVQEAVTSGAIDAQMGVAFELAAVGPDEWSDSLKTDINPEKVRARVDSFINPLKDIDGSTPESRYGIVKTALQNYNDGKLNINELSFILRVANGKSTEPQNPVWGFLKSAVQGMISENPGIKSSAQIMEKFQQRWDFKQDPREVMKQAAIDQFKEDRPETASYKVGDVIKRKSGSFEVVGFSENGQPIFRKK